MNRRSFIVLVVAAVALALLAVLGQRGGGDTSIAGATAGSAVLPGLAQGIDEVVGITVTGAGGERLVTLESGEDGWRVAERDGYPAATSRVNALLIDLAEARIVEEKTADPAFYDRLGVEPLADATATGLELGIESADGSRRALILGDAYGNDERYARAADGERSVLIDRDPDVARDPADWVEPVIVDIAAERIRRVAIAHADGETLVLEKPDPAAANFDVVDLPAGRELDYAGVANVTAEVLEALNLDEVAPRDPEAAASVALAVAEFTGFDGLVVTVTARAADEGAAWLEFAAGTAAAAAEAEAAAVSDAVAAEAAALNARLGAWRYRIPAFKYSQLTRRLEDLLSPLPAAE